MMHGNEAEEKNRTEGEVLMIRTWVMTFVHLFLIFCVVAAASRLPLYWENRDIARLLSVCLFGLLVAIGFGYNIWVHVQLRRMNALEHSEGDGVKGLRADLLRG